MVLRVFPLADYYLHFLTTKGKCSKRALWLFFLCLLSSYWRSIIPSFYPFLYASKYFSGGRMNLSLLPSNGYNPYSDSCPEVFSLHNWKFFELWMNGCFSVVCGEDRTVEEVLQWLSVVILMAVSKLNQNVFINVEQPHADNFCSLSCLLIQLQHSFPLHFIFSHC